MFFSCGYGSVLERKRYGWRKATKAQNSLAEKIIPADHKRTHAEIARKGKQSSHDTGTLHWNSMKHSAYARLRVNLPSTGLAGLSPLPQQLQVQR